MTKKRRQKTRNSGIHKIYTVTMIFFKHRLNFSVGQLYLLNSSFIFFCHFIHLLPLLIGGSSVYPVYHFAVFNLSNNRLYADRRPFWLGIWQAMFHLWHGSYEWLDIGISVVKSQYLSCSVLAIKLKKKKRKERKHDSF